MFDRIHLWSHLALGFCFGGDFWSSFDFSACDWLGHNFCFSLVQSGEIELFKYLFISSMLYLLLTYSCSKSLVIFCISGLSAVTYFSFLILLTWVFSLFLLISLANGLSILLIFSKNQFLFHWSLLFSPSFLFHLFLLSSLFLSFY